MSVVAKNRSRKKAKPDREVSEVLNAFASKTYIFRDGQFYTSTQPDRVTQAPVGDRWPLGTMNSNGTYRVRVLGKNYSGARLAWLIEYKEWPKGKVKHIDGDKSNNQIDNLYTGSKPREYEKCKYRGVTCRDGKYIARFSNIYIGQYDTEEEAALAWNKVAKKHFKISIRLNKVDVKKIQKKKVKKIVPKK